MVVRLIGIVVSILYMEVIISGSYNSSRFDEIRLDEIIFTIITISLLVNFILVIPALIHKSPLVWLMLRLSKPTLTYIIEDTLINLSAAIIYGLIRALIFPPHRHKEIKILIEY